MGKFCWRTLLIQIRCQEELANAFTVPVSRRAFSIRLEPPLAESEGSTTHTKKRLEKVLVLFLNKSNRDVTNSDQIRSDQSLSRVRFFATLRMAALQASLSITNSQSSLRLTSIESVMPSSHLILCRSLLLLPLIPPSIRVFQWVNSSNEVAKVLEFQL